MKEVFKMKKLLSFIVTLSILLCATFPVSASDTTCSYSLKEYAISNTVNSKYTIVEVNTITNNLRQYISDTIGENKGAKLTIYFKYNNFSSYDLLGYNNMAMIMINSNCISTINQQVQVTGNSATFDWDTIFSNTNWERKTGLIQSIDLGVNFDTIITGFSVYIPDQSKFKELSAGACCYETTTVLQ